ncbi:hypothetical protein ACFLZ4_00630 [Patescibacteria group bacterium]
MKIEKVDNIYIADERKVQETDTFFLVEHQVGKRPEDVVCEIIHYDMDVVDEVLEKKKKELGGTGTGPSRSRILRISAEELTKTLKS